MGGFATGYRFEHKNRKFFVKKVFNITIRSNAIPGMTHYIKTESAKMKLEDWNLWRAPCFRSLTWVTFTFNKKIWNFTVAFFWMMEVVIWEKFERNGTLIKLRPLLWRFALGWEIWWTETSSTAISKNKIFWKKKKFSDARQLKPPWRSTSLSISEGH